MTRAAARPNKLSALFGRQEHRSPVQMELSEKVMEVAAGWSYSVMVADSGMTLGIQLVFCRDTPLGWF